MHWCETNTESKFRLELARKDFQHSVIVQKFENDLEEARKKSKQLEKELNSKTNVCIKKLNETLKNSEVQKSELSKKLGVAEKEVQTQKIVIADLKKNQCQNETIQFQVCKIENKKYWKHANTISTCYLPVNSTRPLSNMTDDVLKNIKRKPSK